MVPEPALVGERSQARRSVRANRSAGGAFTAMLVAAGLAVLLGSIAVTVTIGPAELSVRDVYAVLFDKLGVRDSELSAIRAAAERNRPRNVGESPILRNTRLST